MYNYVNEDAFFAWYEEKTGVKPDKKALLARLAKDYMSTRRAEFVLPAENCLSGVEERYPFRFENVGCCGASTIYFNL